MNAKRLVRFGWLTSVAVGGSLFYGATLAHVLPDWRLSHGALWITLSAGSSWIVFGLLLWAITRKPALDLAEASLWTMAVGECVLTIGGLLNLAGATASDPIRFNMAIV